MKIDGFQWDDGNRAKCQKHGVTVEEIEALFVSGNVIAFPDPFPDEERLRGVGKAIGGRYIFMVWTVRGSPDHHLIRPISARYMHAKEVAYYEQAQP